MRAAEQLIAEKLTPTLSPPTSLPLTVAPPELLPPEPLSPEPLAAEAAAPKRIDYTLTFARMARVVRIATSMQARLMAAQPETKTREIKPWPFHMDPRSEPLRAALDHVVTNHPDECHLRINATQRADSELIWDCFKDIPLETLYDRIVADMGLKTTFADLPPAFQKPAFQKPAFQKPAFQKPQFRIPEP